LGGMMMAGKSVVRFLPPMILGMNCSTLTIEGLR
jgi:hypothetical protein